MVKTYNIYCDESTHLPNDGRPYMLLGYTCVPYPLMKEAKLAINDIKDKYGFTGEMKWSGINRKTEPMYLELIAGCIISFCTIQRQMQKVFIMYILTLRTRVVI